MLKENKMFVACNLIASCSHVHVNTGAWPSWLKAMVLRSIHCKSGASSNLAVSKLVAVFMCCTVCQNEIKLVGSLILLTVEMRTHNHRACMQHTHSRVHRNGTTLSTHLVNDKYFKQYFRGMRMDRRMDMAGCKNG